MVVATRKANLPLNLHTATNDMLLRSNSTKDSLLLNRNMVTTKDLPSPTSTRDPVDLLPLLQLLSNSAMALPIATTLDTQTAPAGEKPFSSVSTISTSADSCAAVSTMFAT
jgi:hypothetical protein